MYNGNMTNVMPISKVRDSLPKLVDLADSVFQKTYITVKGTVKAAIVNARELELMEETLKILEDPKTMDAIKKGKNEVSKGQLVDWEDIKEELNI